MFIKTPTLHLVCDSIFSRSQMCITFCDYVNAFLFYFLCQGMHHLHQEDTRLQSHQHDMKGTLRHRHVLVHQGIKVTSMRLRGILHLHPNTYSTSTMSTNMILAVLPSSEAVWLLFVVAVFWKSAAAASRLPDVLNQVHVVFSDLLLGTRI
ncbi:hypothetical protein F0562_034548 [Nyssa sinensis]|uniref:Uncharacterized protein n=1 Tax=Nyssa sinensis TaxID=561372 RepID=A0A5J5ALQ7_9ASTE|nr:hypothetical protein F0562_034548 [Nyssa sinensis]